MQDTIYAFATPEGRSAIAVLRISGSQCKAIMHEMLSRPLRPREAGLVKLRSPGNGEVLDQIIAIWHPAPASFTGEDCLELHLHGSQAVRKAVIQTLSGIEGCRLADPGDFTRRAFLNGKTDLAQLEGLADLLEAETEAQRKQAITQLDGWVERKCGAWREKLVSSLALLEASIDFADEGDAPLEVLDEVRGNVLRLLGEFDDELRLSEGSRIIRDGFCVVIAGAPNSGKSSLLNAIARRDVAIVTDIAGTTRDVIEVTVDLGGQLVRFLDTAGIRDSADRVEQIGVERSRQASKTADLVLWLDASGPAYECDRDLPAGFEDALVIYSMSDLYDSIKSQEENDIFISAKTGFGILSLLQLVSVRCAQMTGRGEAGFIVQERQRKCLLESRQALERVKESLSQAAIELISEELRSANDALSRLVGKIGTEDVLGAIFSRFCMGK